MTSTMQKHVCHAAAKLVEFLSLPSGAGSTFLIFRVTPQPFLQRRPSRLRFGFQVSQGHPADTGAKTNVR